LRIEYVDIKATATLLGYTAFFLLKGQRAAVVTELLHLAVSHQTHFFKQCA
jgi:hypothetical protein